MLSQSGLGHEFWIEVVATSCFLVSRSLSIAIEYKTPFEVWSGSRDNYT